MAVVCFFLEVERDFKAIRRTLIVYSLSKTQNWLIFRQCFIKNPGNMVVCEWNDEAYHRVARKLIIAL